MESQQPSALHILSFDLEEWFYLYSPRPDFDAEFFWQKANLRAEIMVDRLLALLHDSGQSATFFTMGRFARQYPQLIKRIAASGNEIGAHSDLHEYAKNQSLNRFQADLQANMSTLQDLMGQSPISYRTPAYSIDTRLAPYREKLMELNIRYDSSLKSGTSGEYGKVPNKPFQLQFDKQITYLPVSAWPVLNGWPYAGSGFFRLMPAFVVDQELSKPGYHMMYFHPRDFDPEMKVLPKEWSNKWKYGLGTGSSFSRLRHLLQRYRCLSIADAAQSGKIASHLEHVKGPKAGLE